MEQRIYFYVNPEIEAEINGFGENARLIPNVYPGWETVLITPETADAKILGEIATWKDVRIIRHPATHPIQHYGLVELVHASTLTPNHRFLIRSPYCRVCAREAAAVAQWCSSNAQFHVIRDHPELHNFPIVPNLWGSFMARLNNIPRTLVQWLDTFYKGSRKEAVDPSSLVETALAEVVWPKAKHWGCMRHDIAPRAFEHGEALPFPDYEQDGQQNCGYVYLPEEKACQEDENQ
jgi:hypothetical protein